jgi:hypothetical protein
VKRKCQGKIDVEKVKELRYQLHFIKNWKKEWTIQQKIMC